MVTGKRPIDGGSEYAILNAHLTPDTAGAGDPEPGGAGHAERRHHEVARQTPGDRFQTAAEFRETLRRIEGFTTLTSVVTESVSVPRRTSPRPANPLGTSSRRSYPCAN